MRSVISHGKQIGLLLASAFALGCTAKSGEGGYTQQEADVATSTEPAVRLEQPKNRAEAEAQLETAKVTFEAEPNDAKRRAYAQALFQVGDIWDAAEIIAPLAKEDSDIAIDVLVGAQAALFLFDLDRAEQLFDRLLAITEEGSEDYKHTIHGLTMVYYQTQQFHKAEKLPTPGDETPENESLITYMQRFEGSPYQIEWVRPEKTGHIPFINDIREPGVLPLSKVAINGEEFEFILDTGGDRLVLDKGLAEQAGVEIIGSTQSKYAYTGGETVDEFFAVADKVEFDGVTIKNVPVHLNDWKSRGLQSDGVITTGLLKQFLSTMDYDNNEITLRERTPESRKKFLSTLDSKSDIISVPFYLAATHLMFAKGVVNDRENMNMFMDSGLAMSMPGVLPNETVDLLDLDKTDIEGTKYYWVPLDQFGLNNVQRVTGRAVGNIFVEEDLYWLLGFPFDALLSHQYLWPLGSWTIDFDEMAFYFPG